MRRTTSVQVPATTTRKQTIQDLLHSDSCRNAVAAALPSHLKPDRFMRIALTAVTRTPKLAECDQASFFQALLTLSQLGLEPDGRRAHLIPFLNRKRNVHEVVLIVDYKGIVELVMRTGNVSFIHADVVCENDDFEFDRGEIKRHKIDLRSARGKVYAAYAFVRFKDGTEKCEVMSRDEIESVRQRSRASNDGPWVSDWNEMAKKTVFRRLSKWVELSPEQRDVIESDDQYAGLEATHRAEKAVRRSATVTEFLESQVPDTEDASADPEPTKENGHAEPEPKESLAQELAHELVVERFEELRKKAGPSKCIELKEACGWPNITFKALGVTQLTELCDRLEEWLANKELAEADAKFGPEKK